MLCKEKDCYGLIVLDLVVGSEPVPAEEVRADQEGVWDLGHLRRLLATSIQHPVVSRSFCAKVLSPWAASIPASRAMDPAAIAITTIITTASTSITIGEQIKGLGQTEHTGRPFTLPMPLSPPRLAIYKTFFNY